MFLGQGPDCISTKVPRGTLPTALLFCGEPAYTVYSSGFLSIVLKAAHCRPPGRGLSIVMKTDCPVFWGEVSMPRRRHRGQPELSLPFQTGVHFH